MQFARRNQPLSVVKHRAGKLEILLVHSRLLFQQPTEKRHDGRRSYYIGLALDGVTVEGDVTLDGVIVVGEFDVDGAVSLKPSNGTKGV